MVVSLLDVMKIGNNIQAGIRTYLFQEYFMKVKINMDAVYTASSGVVVREVESEMIIIPFASGIDDSENEPYFLNSTGKVIWQRLDGRKSLKDIVADLATEYETPVKVIKKDVIEFVGKLLIKKMLVEVSRT
jgi:hypothetical protein